MAKQLMVNKVRRDGVTTHLRIAGLEFWCAKVSAHWLLVSAETECADEAQWAFKRAERYEQHLGRVRSIGRLL